MTERRDRDTAGPQSARPAARKSDATVLELGSQVGNKAMAELLGPRPAATPPASAGLRVLDAIRAGAPPAQREFALVAQRDLKEELKAPGRLLKVGTQGEDVKELQGLLGVTADGIFGRNTRAAVISFQKSNGLAADGIVGPITWPALVARADQVRAKDFGSAKPDDGTLKGESASTDKLAPASTDKLAPASTDKLAPASTAKLAPESTDKVPQSTAKLVPESTDKLDSFK